MRELYGAELSRWLKNEVHMFKVVDFELDIWVVESTVTRNKIQSDQLWYTYSILLRIVLPNSCYQQIARFYKNLRKLQTNFGIFYFFLAKFKIKQICLLSDYRQCVHSYKLSLWFYDATSCTWKYLAFCIIYCVI